MSVQERIEDKLSTAFAPEHLEVVNESHHHAGHAGSPGTGDSHYRVLIVSAAFAGKSRIERHRMVNATLGDELRMGLHALAIKGVGAGRDDRLKRHAGRQGCARPAGRWQACSLAAGRSYQWRLGRQTWTQRTVRWPQRQSTTRSMWH